jgi:hypothetical protein
MNDKDRAWLRKRFVDLEKRTTEQISRLRLQQGSNQRTKRSLVLIARVTSCHCLGDSG